MAQLITVGQRGIIQIHPRTSSVPLIGSGRSCMVHLGFYDKQEVAVKKIIRDEAKFEKEACELRKLRHPNIVHYHFFDYDDNFEYIVMEKCECSLEKYLKSTNGQLNELKAMKEISMGLKYLHSFGGIHRNLHPSNILLCGISSGDIVAKIADFGIMKHSPDGSSVGCSGRTGSLRFNNPEELRKQKVSKKSDIFSLGLCFFAVYTGNKNPYGDDELDISNAIYHGKPYDLSLISRVHNGYAVFLISSMLNDSRKARPNINEVLSHYLFWDADKTMVFLQRASDAVKSDESLAMSLESKCAVDKDEWWEILYEDLDQDSVEVFWQHFWESPPRGRGPPSGAYGLLRQVRNWCHHFHELKPPEVQHLLGGTKQKMIDLLAKKFPRLLPMAYDVFQSQKTQTDFSKFYQPDIN